MDNFEKTVNDLFEIESIDEIIFKFIEISPNMTIYFAFRESQKIIFERLTSIDLTPVCFILKIDDEYYWCPLNDEELDEKIIEEFSLKFIS